MYTLQYLQVYINNIYGGMRMSKLLKRIGLLLTLVMVLSIILPVGTLWADASSYDVYTVKSGDVLWKIAEKLDTTYEELAKINNLKNVHLIQVGQELKIPKKLISLDIYSVNDFHGTLLAAGKNPGMAKLGKYLKDQKAKNQKGTLILSAGDMFQGSMDSNLLYGKPVVDAMNEIGFDAMTIGNHEFDWGFEKVNDWMKAAKFDFIATNIIDNNTGKPVDYLKPYVIYERNGVKVGVIGLATPETAYKTSPKLVANYTFEDPVKIVNEMVPLLKKEGAEVIVVLSHLGADMNKETGEVTGEAVELAKGLEGVDAIISGHTHRTVAGIVNDIPIVQAYYNGREAGHVNLLYSKDEKKVVEKTVESVSIMAIEGLIDDEEVKAIVDKYQVEIAPVKNLVLGKTVNELNHDRYKNSILGQWSTDVMREATGVDIAFQNGGGLRTSIAAGDITMGNLYEVMPFDNTLFTVELTGKQVIDVLNHGIGNEEFGDVQFSGIKVKYDKAKPEGERVVEVTMLDGSKLEEDKIYKVVTNDFMGAGGDKYTMFLEGKNAVDTFSPVRDAFVDAIKKVQTIDFKGDDRLIIEEVMELDEAA